MGTEVVWTSSAPEVLDRAGVFLAADPVRHNLILTLLLARAKSHEPGRYWMAVADGDVVGVVFQSPLELIATATPMSEHAIAAVVESIVAGGIRLPGISAVATTAAYFAGCWTETARTAARAHEGQRLYELATVHRPAGVQGTPRVAGPGDVELLTQWFLAFNAEVGESARPVERDMTEARTQTRNTVAHRVTQGELWIWEDEGPVTVVGVSAPVEGVARVGPVYTPPGLRRRGYASALTAELSQATVEHGCRCILYTQLDNPTSNAVYRDIGYRAVAELLVYYFA